MVGKELWSAKEIVKIFLMIFLAATWTGLVVIIANSYSLIGLNMYNDILRSITIFLISLVAISPVFIFGLYLSNYKQFIKMID